MQSVCCLCQTLTETGKRGKISEQTPKLTFLRYVPQDSGIEGWADMARLAIATVLRMHLKVGLGRMWCINTPWNEITYHSFQSWVSGEQLPLWIP